MIALTMHRLRGYNLPSFIQVGIPTERRAQKHSLLLDIHGKLWKAEYEGDLEANTQLPPQMWAEGFLAGLSASPGHFQGRQFRPGPPLAPQRTSRLAALRAGILRWVRKSESPLKQSYKARLSPVSGLDAETVRDGGGGVNPSPTGAAA